MRRSPRWIVAAWAIVARRERARAIAPARTRRLLIGSWPVPKPAARAARLLFFLAFFTLQGGFTIGLVS